MHFIKSHVTSFMVAHMIRVFCPCFWSCLRRSVFASDDACFSRHWCSTLLCVCARRALFYFDAITKWLPKCWHVERTLRHYENCAEGCGRAVALFFSRLKKILVIRRPSHVLQWPWHHACARWWVCNLTTVFWCLNLCLHAATLIVVLARTSHGSSVVQLWWFNFCFAVSDIK